MDGGGQCSFWRHNNPQVITMLTGWDFQSFQGLWCSWPEWDLLPLTFGLRWNSLISFCFLPFSYHWDVNWALATKYRWHFPHLIYLHWEMPAPHHGKMVALVLNDCVQRRIPIWNIIYPCYLGMLPDPLIHSNSFCVCFICQPASAVPCFCIDLKSALHTLLLDANQHNLCTKSLQWWLFWKSRYLLPVYIISYSWLVLSTLNKHTRHD